MKTFLSIILTLAFATSALAAAGSGGAAFGLYSGASAKVTTTDAYNVRGFKTKTLTVSGATVESTAAAVTFDNMSGTVIAQCAPSTTGPWSTCTQSQVASAPAVSLTANNQLTWSDAVAYVRLQWTAGTVKKKFKAWFNWTDN